MNNETVKSDNIKLLWVLKRSVCIFVKNWVLFLTTAFLIHFLIYQLFSNLLNWIKSEFEYDISPAIPVLSFFTTAIFLTWAYCRLALDLLKPDLSMQKKTPLLSRILLLGGPRDDGDWKCLCRIAVVVVMNWIIIVAIKVSVIFLVKLNGWMIESVPPMVFWIILLSLIIILFFVYYKFLIISIRCSLTIPIIIVDNQTVRRAFVGSWRMTAGNVEKIFNVAFGFPIIIFWSNHITTLLLQKLLRFMELQDQAIYMRIELFCDPIFSGLYAMAIVFCYFHLQKQLPCNKGEVLGND